MRSSMTTTTADVSATSTQPTAVLTSASTLFRKNAPSCAGRPRLSAHSRQRCRRLAACHNQSMRLFMRSMGLD